MTAPAFALVLGLVYAALGVAGGFAGASGLLNGFHFAIGLWGLLAWSGTLGSVSYARAVSVLLALAALAGLALPAVSLPLHGPSIWLHGITAAIAGYVGFRSMTRRKPRHAAHAERRHQVAADRRLAARPTAYERRRGSADRRFGAGAPLASGF